MSLLLSLVSDQYTCKRTVIITEDTHVYCAGQRIEEPGDKVTKSSVVYLKDGAELSPEQFVSSIEAIEVARTVADAVVLEEKIPPMGPLSVQTSKGPGYKGLTNKKTIETIEDVYVLSLAKATLVASMAIFGLALSK